MTKTVAIFGSTGAQGAPVVREALSNGLQVRAIGREAEKVEGMHPEAISYSATLDDKEALAKALEGVDAAFLHLPIPENSTDAENWLKTFFEAAHQVELPLLVYTTSGPTGDRYPQATTIDARTAEMRQVMSCGIPSIVLQSTLYLENLLVDLFLPRLHTEGVIDYPPLPSDLKVQWISHLDQARIAVAALQRPDLAGNSYEIGTPEALTGSELAKIVTHWIDKPATFEPASPLSFSQRVGDVLGNPGAEFVLNDLYGALAKLGSEDMVIDTKEIEDIFGVKLVSLEEHIKNWAKQ